MIMCARCNKCVHKRSVRVDGEDYTVTNLTQQRLGYQDSKLHTLLDETFKCINAGKTELAKKKLSEFFLYGENASPPLKAMSIILKNMIDRQMAHS